MLKTVPVSPPRRRHPPGAPAKSADPASRALGAAADGQVWAQTGTLPVDEAADDEPQRRAGV
ncbi:hypothetical protein ACWDZW_40740 [Streptomyces coeruleorubidus]